jgi:hypothetical protein
MGTVLSCTATALVFLVAPASAQETPPSPGGSAVDQYVEAVVTGSGPSYPGVTKEKRTPLPRAARRALKQAGPSTANALEDVATSSAYGAPAVSPRPTKTGSRFRDNVPPAPSFRAALDNAVTAVGTTSDTRLLGLLVVLAGATAGALALAVRRARV